MTTPTPSAASRILTDDTMVTVQPTWGFEGEFRLPASGRSVSNIAAGLPCRVPVGLAHHWRHRHLLHSPPTQPWWNIETLTAVLQAERSSAALTSTLPVDFKLWADSVPPVEDNQVLHLLMDDICRIRLDKLRRQWVSAVSTAATTVIPLPGIATHEAALVRPLLQQALNDVQGLRQQQPSANNQATTSVAKSVHVSSKSTLPEKNQTTRRRPLRRFRVPEEE